LVDAALKLGDRELQLRMEPLRFAEPDPAFEQARARLADIRSALVLDTESERLLRDMSVMTRQYDSYLIALRHWQDLTEQAKAAMAAGMGAPPITGQKEALEQLQKLGEQLAMFVNNVIDSARATLAELEQPIGSGRPLCRS
jgi:phosphoglycolate phosphatase-like HAD superfamily hydrolase